MTEAIIQKTMESKKILEEAALVYCAKVRGSKFKEKVIRLLSEANKNRVLRDDRFENYRNKSPELTRQIVLYVEKLIKEKKSSAELVDSGEAIGILLAAGGATTTQVVGFLDSVKSLQVGDLDAGKIALLRPRLSYSVARHKQLEPLLEVLEPWFKGKNMIEGSADDLKKEFAHFANFVETIVAFHRYYEVKERR